MCVRVCACMHVHTLVALCEVHRILKCCCSPNFVIGAHIKIPVWLVSEVKVNEVNGEKEFSLKILKNNKYVALNKRHLDP